MKNCLFQSARKFETGEVTMAKKAVDGRQESVSSSNEAASGMLIIHFRLWASSERSVIILSTVFRFRQPSL